MVEPKYLQAIYSHQIQLRLVSGLNKRGLGVDFLGVEDSQENGNGTCRQSR